MQTAKRINRKDSVRYDPISGFAHLFLLVAVIITAIGVISYFAYQNAQLKNQLYTTSNSLPTETPTKEDKFLD